VAAVMRSTEEKMLKKGTAITCVLQDIGRVSLPKGGIINETS
jgi:hypothetical protein